MQGQIEFIEKICGWLGAHLDFNVVLWALVGWCVGMYLDLRDQIKELERKIHD